MGAWDAGNFENDTALDWAWDLEASTDLSAIKAAISDVLHADDLDAGVGCTGLAAAEVVAALRNRPLAGLPEKVSHWVATHPLVPDDTLVQDCRAAVHKIRHDQQSELKELWEEDAENAAEWYAAVDDLTTRLR